MWFQDENDQSKVCKPFSWIHSDIMDDNIHMELCGGNNSILREALKDAKGNGCMNGCGDASVGKWWHPSHILDFSDLSMG